MSIFTGRTVRIALAAALLAGTAGVGASLAQGGGWGHQRGEHRAERAAMIGWMMKRMDTDGDGAVSRAEAEAFRTARMAGADADADGSVTEAEFIAHAQARAAERAKEMFARMDADGDGRLLAADLSGRGERRLERMFARLDRNSDGLVSSDEAHRAGGRPYHGRID